MKKAFRFLRVTMLWIIALPYTIGGTGVALNQAVLIANHGKFPVMLNNRQQRFQGVESDGFMDDYHCNMTHDTRLNALGDIFHYNAAYVSVGDMLIDIGDWLSEFCAYIWGVLVCLKLLANNVVNRGEQ